jgi:D-3-phosphoglycerate dehydrogenase / 2-oxoglutarate reductase
MIPKILIIDKLHECILSGLREMGFEVDYLPEISNDEVYQCIPNYTGLILRSKMPIDAGLINRASKLRFIARAGAGVDEIDLTQFANRKITLLNAPEGNRDALAEHAMGLLLCLFNHIHIGNHQVANGIWTREANRGIEIAGKTIGIIGYGHMGEAFAQRLSSFSCKVLAYDKYRMGPFKFAEKVDLQDIFDRADILSLHLPLTSETKAMVGAKFLDSFKKPVYLLNTARGEIVELEALWESINSGNVLGAGLDVLENEKFETLTPQQKEVLTKLNSSGKVLFTPHVGGWTVESYRKISEVLLRKIEHWTYNASIS